MSNPYESIFDRNKDVEHIVNAAAGVGRYGLGGVFPKRFALLVGTDFHRCQKQVINAVDYLNGMEALDACINLGDTQGSNYTENDGSWYYMAVNKTEKPFYTVIGNHDGGNSAQKEISGTKAEVMNKFIASTRTAMHMPALDKTYYSVRFEEKNITLIVLDNYMAPEQRNEAGDFELSRAAECLNQEETDWLIQTLNEVPEGDHVLIARHSYPDSAEAVHCCWTQQGSLITSACPPYGACEIVPDIVDAWMNGSTLRKTYAPLPGWPNVPTLTAEADFTARGKGIFIAYLIGHTHRDTLGKSAVYPRQNIICFASSANDDWQNHDSDLPRMRGTKAEDCLTVAAADTEKRRLHLVRVGSCITSDLVERKYITVSY